MRRSPRWYASQLVDVAEDAPTVDVPALMQRFVRAIRRRGQGRLLPAVLTAVERVWNERHGIASVRVTGARSIDVGPLSASLGPQAAVAATVDERLIGGVILQRDDERTDASVRGRLERLRTTLTRKE